MRRKWYTIPRPAVALLALAGLGTASAQITLNQSAFQPTAVVSSGTVTLVGSAGTPADVGRAQATYDRFLPGPHPPTDPFLFAAGEISLAAQDTGSGNAPLLTWTTTAEPAILGFDVYRAEWVGGDHVVGDRLTTLPIAAMGGPSSGASYDFFDPVVFTHGSGNRAYFVAAISTTASADFYGTATLIDPAATTDTWFVY